MISVVIPAYNEEQSIKNCLESLKDQEKVNFEIIVVDDGSTEHTYQTVANLVQKIKNLRVYKLPHKGPGRARNYGAKKAKGDILVFVDSDMTFAKDFLYQLTKPIINKETMGTFTKEEYVSNWTNRWARCWNYNDNIKENRRIPANFPDQSPVFRAILAKEFYRVSGFDVIGYTDDWTLSRKLRVKASLAPHAVCYHQNPATLKEVSIQARWIGKNEFLNKGLKKIFNLFKYSPPFSLVIGLFKSLIYKEPRFLFFKIVYDWGIIRGIINRSFSKNINK